MAHGEGDLFRGYIICPLNLILLFSITFLLCTSLRHFLRVSVSLSSLHNFPPPSIPSPSLSLGFLFAFYVCPLTRTLNCS